jgi:hypothetical protein
VPLGPGCISSRPALVGTNSISHLDLWRKAGISTCFLFPPDMATPSRSSLQPRHSISKQNTTARLKPEQGGQLLVVIAWKNLEHTHTTFAAQPMRHHPTLPADLPSLGPCWAIVQSRRHPETRLLQSRHMTEPACCSLNVRVAEVAGVGTPF